jgi:hypothetical protein
MKHASSGLAIILIAAVLAACGTSMGWSKAGGTPQEFERTRADCKLQRDAGLVGLVDGKRDERFQACMRANGWALVSRPS